MSVRDHRALHADVHILDAGYSSGRDILYFLNKGYKVTAIDASKELSKLASDLIKQLVLNISFQEIDFENEFDGVWASASLLHIPKNEINDVLSLIAKALKVNGVLYASFKYGDREYEKEGRYFNCYDESSIDELINKNNSLTLIKRWTSSDSRTGRQDEIWLNCFVRNNKNAFLFPKNLD
ncbi:MAG TPA: class I SAM-dependent methyltransferase [Segetibacter sp.]|jgi:SAM-dependent methyltransferase